MAYKNVTLSDLQTHFGDEWYEEIPMIFRWNGGPRNFFKNQSEISSEIGRESFFMLSPCHVAAGGLN